MMMVIISLVYAEFSFSSLVHETDAKAQYTAPLLTLKMIV